jgi:dephospho-CoA kinase
MEVVNGKNIYKIAFMGKMGSGKTSVAYMALGLLNEKYGGLDKAIGYIIKFANPLHQTAVAFHRTEKPRVFLQRLGDLARREFGDSVFEKIFQENVEGLLMNKLPTLSQEHVLIMTDDLRFRGEYELAKQLGFTVIKVDADEEVRRRRIGDTFVNVKHRSETEQELFEPDFVLYNNDDDPFMLALESQFKELINQHKLFGE